MNKIKELNALLAMATPRHWKARDEWPEHDPGGTVWVLDDNGKPYCTLADCRPGGVANAQLIAAMHEALPALLEVAMIFQSIAHHIPSDVREAVPAYATHLENAWRAALEKLEESLNGSTYKPSDD